jgi:hypothetical protein
MALSPKISIHAAPSRARNRYLEIVSARAKAKIESMIESLSIESEAVDGAMVAISLKTQYEFKTLAGDTQRNRPGHSGA